MLLSIALKNNNKNNGIRATVTIIISGIIYILFIFFIFIVHLAIIGNLKLKHNNPLFRLFSQGAFIYLISPVSASKSERPYRRS